MWHTGDGMGWWMLFGMIWMIVFWSGIIWLIIWGVTQVTGNRRGADGQSPLDIASRRYASGEITREQFEQIKQDLG